jgi:hypothetical protein
MISLRIPKIVSITPTCPRPSQVAMRASCCIGGTKAGYFYD